MLSQERQGRTRRVCRLSRRMMLAERSHRLRRRYQFHHHHTGLHPSMYRPSRSGARRDRACSIAYDINCGSGHARSNKKATESDPRG